MDNLMVSRLVAIRLGVPSASAGAMQTIEREFAGRPMSEVAQALAQKELQLGAEWDAPYGSSAFTELLRREALSRCLINDLRLQNGLFLEHLAARSDGTNRVILCDTGLYCSTVRCLEEAQPQKQWSCVLFARSNYARLSAPHFATTVGLSVEQDHYSVLNARTAVLRFWHLFESVLEPTLPSVTKFSRECVGGEPVSNLQVAHWPDRICSPCSPIFSGILKYMETLPSRSTADYILSEAALAWPRLAKCIIYPTRKELSAICVPDRSHDFGREGKFPCIRQNEAGLRSKLRGLQGSLWREGYIAASFPRFRTMLLLGVQALYLFRCIWLNSKKYLALVVANLDQGQRCAR